MSRSGSRVGARRLMNQGFGQPPPLSPREGWLSDGRQVLRFRPVRYGRFSQALKLTVGVLIHGQAPLLKQRKEPNWEPEILELVKVDDIHRCTAHVFRAELSMSLEQLQLLEGQNMALGQRWGIAGGIDLKIPAGRSSPSCGRSSGDGATGAAGAGLIRRACAGAGTRGSCGVPHPAMCPATAAPVERAGGSKSCDKPNAGPARPGMVLG